MKYFYENEVKITKKNLLTCFMTSDFRFRKVTIKKVVKAECERSDKFIRCEPGKKPFGSDCGLESRGTRMAKPPAFV